MAHPLSKPAAAVVCSNDVSARRSGAEAGAGRGNRAAADLAEGLGVRRRGPFADLEAMRAAAELPVGLAAVGSSQDCRDDDGAGAARPLAFATSTTASDRTKPSAIAHRARPTSTRDEASHSGTASGTV